MHLHSQAGAWERVLSIKQLMIKKIKKERKCALFYLGDLYRQKITESYR